MSTDIGDLDELVLESILFRLPVKSLIRFQLVCKSWHSLIIGTYFAFRHRAQRSLQSRENKVRTLLIDEYKYIDSHDIIEENGVSPWWKNQRWIKKKGVSLWRKDQGWKERKRIEWPTACADYHRIESCVHGLLCITFACFPLVKVVLWNPSIRKCVRVPDEFGYSVYALAEGRVNVGSGVDPLSYDYKVVSIQISRRLDIPKEFFPVSNVAAEAKIYSLKDHRVKSVPVSCIPPDSYMDVNHDSAFVNGFINWYCNIAMPHPGGGCGKDKSDPYLYRAPLILSFDVHNESFGTLLTPFLPRRKDEEPSVGMIKFKGRLALYQHRYNDNELVIWSITKCGAVESWVIMLTLDITNSWYWTYLKISTVAEDEEEVERAWDKSTSDDLCSIVSSGAHIGERFFTYEESLLGLSSSSSA